MEPRSFNRGDVHLLDDGGDEVSLQWSHGRLTVVTYMLPWRMLFKD